MGPFLLIDKSALQGLSEKNLVTLYRHYSVIICPVLIQEIRANLVASPNDTTLSQSKVTWLAKRASGFGSETIDFHSKLIQADLFGSGIKLAPQIPRFDLQEFVAPDGSKGLLADETEEQKTLRRWASGSFTEGEYSEASDHVSAVTNYGLEDSSKHNAELYPSNAQFETLDDLARFTDHPTFESSVGAWALIESQMKGFSASASEMETVHRRWVSLGSPPFKQFAEYAQYSHRLNSIFWIGVTSGIVPLSKHAKAIIDYQYFYYLPFTFGFCSADKFHRDFSKYFLRSDQRFIWRDDLKADLEKIEACKDAMSASEKKYYEIHFGNRPPPIPNSITGEVWNDYAGPWKEFSGNLVSLKTEEENKATLAFLDGLLKGKKT